MGTTKSKQRREQILLWLVDGAATKNQITRMMLSQSFVDCPSRGSVERDLELLRDAGLIACPQRKSGRPGHWRLTRDGHDAIAPSVARIRARQQRSRPPAPWLEFVGAGAP